MNFVGLEVLKRFVWSIKVAAVKKCEYSTKIYASERRVVFDFKTLHIHGNIQQIQTQNTHTYNLTNEASSAVNWLSGRREVEQLWPKLQRSVRMEESIIKRYLLHNYNLTGTQLAT